MTALQYLRQQFESFGNFTKDYIELSAPERAELKKYAEEEMAALGISVEKIA